MIKITNLKRTMKLVGVEVQPEEVFERGSRQWQQMLHGSLEHSVPPPFITPPSLVTPVFEDLEGNHFILLARDHEPVPAIFNPSQSVPVDSSLMSQGGFVSLKDFKSLVLKPDKYKTSEQTEREDEVSKKAGEPDRDMLDSIDEDIRQAIKNAIIKKAQEHITLILQDYFRHNLEGAVASELAGKGTSLQDMVEALLNGDLNSIRSKIDDLLSSILNPTAIANMALGVGANQAVDYLLNSLWNVDDASSLEEQLLHKFAKMPVQALANAIKDQIIAELEKLLGIKKDLPKPEVPIIRIGTPPLAIRVKDVDDKGNKVKEYGSPNVFVEGQAIARVEDMLDPANKHITQGSPTVYANAKKVARVTSATAVPSVMIEGATRTFIGDAANVTWLDKKPSPEGDHLEILWGAIDLGPQGSALGCGGGADASWPPDRILTFNFRTPCDMHDKRSKAWADPDILEEGLLNIFIWQAEIFAGIFNSNGAGVIFALPYTIAVTGAALGQYSYWSIYQMIYGRDAIEERGAIFGLKEDLHEISSEMRLRNKSLLLDKYPQIEEF